MTRREFERMTARCSRDTLVSMAYDYARVLTRMPKADLERISEEIAAEDERQEERRRTALRMAARN